MTLSDNWQLKQKIGQMIVVRTSGYLFDHQIRYPVWEATNETLKRWLDELNLGGVILLGGSAAELSLKIKTLQNWSKSPLLICADIEEGVGQRFAGATAFPPPMALGEIAQSDLELAKKLAYKMGEITAKEALTVGINWLLAPVVDVNNNSANPVINIRAFSEDTSIVSQLITSFIEGTKNHPILTTAKHFPGHGDTATDSHLTLPHIAHSVEHLQEIELPPFQAAIKAQVDSIMTAHLLVSAWDQQTSATLSKEILSNQLRQNLGFTGLIVTDALVMGGVKQQYCDQEIAVKAVEAGNDILLMPSDPEIAINAVYDAVQSGIISEARIEQSFQRIKTVKDKLFQQSFADDLSCLSDNESTTVVNEIIESSLSYGGNFPLPRLDNKQGRNLIVVDDLLNLSFLDRQSPSVTIPSKYGYELHLIDYQTLPLILDDKRPTLLQVFLRGNPFRGQAWLTVENKAIYQQLLQQKILKGLVILGSPYIKDWFVEQINNDIPWLFSYGQINASQALALTKLFNLSSHRQQKEENFGF
ncbi:MAG: glycoside hydrolase family 3 N-terminal domain-containing protein [Microcystaceae cyanobacterium]